MLALGLAPSQATAAEPMPCQGLSFTDVADAPANRDIREGWFSFREGRLTANLRLAQVDQELEPGQFAARFVMYYGTRQVPRYAEARTDGTTWSFTYGRDSGGPREGTTTGSVQQGPGGVIEIVIPEVHAREGEELLTVHARTLVDGPAGLAGGSQPDFAPDSGDRQRFAYGRNFVVGPCAQRTPEPAQQPEPGAQEPSGPPAAQPSVPVTPQADPRGAPAPFRVTVPRLRARSLRRGRAFRVTVDSPAPLSRIVLTLVKGGAVFARGRKASLTRASAVRVKARRRIARGTYRLTVRGRRQDGTTATGAVVVRVT